MLTRAAVLLLGALLGLAACRHGDDEAKVPVNLSRPSTALADVPLAAGDIRITSADTAVDLALIGDSISGGLSAFALAKLRRETDTSAVKGSGLGASIEKMVKGTVQSALGTRISVPVSSVKDVRYDGQRLVFEWNGKPPEHFGDAKVNNKDVMASFSSEDAQRFAIAVRARQRARNGQM
ncbi:hypothetical protein BH11GEM2_BH11GEM2_16610 [soil metagenome]